MTTENIKPEDALCIDAWYLEGFTIDEIRYMTKEEVENLKDWGLEYGGGLPVMLVCGGYTNCIFSSPDGGGLFLYKLKSGQLLSLWHKSS